MGGYLLYNTSSSKKISKNSPCFPSQRGNPPSAILFILTAAAAITPHTKYYEIAAMTMHSFVKFNFPNLLFLYVTLHNNCVNWRHKTLLSMTSFARISRCVKPKSQYGLYLVSWDVLYFPRPNKRRLYATPLRSSYLVWLHYKTLFRSGVCR